MEKVDLFRALALEARVAADKAATNQARSVFENVAATYERLANWSACRPADAQAMPKS